MIGAKFAHSCQRVRRYIHSLLCPPAPLALQLAELKTVVDGGRLGPHRTRIPVRMKTPQRHVSEAAGIA